MPLSSTDKAYSGVAVATLGLFSFVGGLVTTEVYDEKAARLAKRLGVTAERLLVLIKSSILQVLMQQGKISLEIHPSPVNLKRR